MTDEQDLLVDEQDYAEAWIPTEKGDTLTGVVSEVTSAYSDQSESMYPIVVVKATDGTEKAIHCFRLVLGNKMRELKPRVGETLTVVFKGIKPNKNNPSRKTYMYTVSVEGRSPDVWGTTPTTQPQPMDGNDNDEEEDTPF